MRRGGGRKGKKNELGLRRRRVRNEGKVVERRGGRGVIEEGIEEEEEEEMEGKGDRKKGGEEERVGEGIGKRKGRKKEEKIWK